MIITRVRPSLYIAGWTALWSCISASTAATHNYGQLIAVRFCLGIVEAPFFPGAMFLLSSYYTRKELAFRTAIFYSGVILATAFAGLIAAGIFAGLDGVRGLAGWRWMYILEGLGSFILAILAAFILPDLPGATTGSGNWIFTAEERAVALDRVRRDRVSEKELKSSPWIGLGACVKDIRTWLFVSIHLITFSFSTVARKYLGLTGMCVLSLLC